MNATLYHHVLAFIMDCVSVAQQKKSTYSVYSLMTSKLLSLIKKQASGAKKSSNRDLLSGFLRQYPDFRGDQSLFILAEEHHLSSNGLQVIFPDSPAILDNLLKARFKIESLEGFDLPFASFVLAMPRGYAFKGVKIPSLMVNWVKKDRMIADVTQPFFNHYGLPAHSFNAIDYASDSVLSIAYADIDGQEKCRTYVAAAHIPTLLSAKNPDDYREEMARQGFIRSALQITEYDGIIQYHAFRLIAALGIYHVATRGERLKEGFPGAAAPRIDGFASQLKLNPITLSNSVPPLKNEDPGRAEHYRTWYFRQLRAERYYQGEYANYSPGTRYSFVQETVVGMKVSANTQT